MKKTSAHQLREPGVSQSHPLEKKCKNPLTNSQTYDTICIQGKGNQTESQEKISKKVLDKLHKMWYNKDTKRTGTSGK